MPSGGLAALPQFPLAQGFRSRPRVPTLQRELWRMRSRSQSSGCFPERLHRRSMRSG
nr:MAG TPA: hypothetical protein [Caudoviricetes sp.]